MKTKLFTYAFLMLLFVIGITSCDKDDDSTPIITFNVTLNGSKEVPANASAATGTATFKYDTITNILSGSVTYTGMTANNAHIHKGALGVKGGTVFPLGAAPFTSPLTLAPTVLDAAKRADLMANLYYVNIHSTAFPDGEIRGQLLKP